MANLTEQQKDAIQALEYVLDFDKEGHSEAMEIVLKEGKYRKGWKKGFSDGFELLMNDLKRADLRAKIEKCGQELTMPKNMKVFISRLRAFAVQSRELGAPGNGFMLSVPQAEKVLQMYDQIKKETT